MNLFVFGMGYSARAVHRHMAARLDGVAGTTRSVHKAAELDQAGVKTFIFDGTTRNAAIAEALPSASPVLVSIAPSEDGDPVLRHYRDALIAARPKSIVYLSTVGVYGDHDGAWVDEGSPCRPVSRRSKWRLAAEAAWQRFAAETGIKVAIIRLSGIYGPDRGPFQKLKNRTSRRIIKPGQVFNRIHVEDIAQIVEAAFYHQASGIFNGTDDEPAPPQDVIVHAAGLLGIDPPPEVRFEDADLSAMARTFYGENKRVRNDKIKAELGVCLAFPTYREGLAACLAAEKQSP
ncbi:MAG TPA: SDR family oxidoreductase [Afifellaceae bacterium]|nr:SDR family oxidoreductase [Afifellaceae bacterium]